MPPFDEDQLTPDEKRKVQTWIEKEVIKLDPASPDPGRVTIRRLNRTEYQNAVFDLLGVEYDTKDIFPAADTGYGFDNIDGPAPEEEAARERYARKIMRSFVSRAFRKPIDNPTIDRLVAIVIRSACWRDSDRQQAGD